MEFHLSVICSKVISKLSKKANAINLGFFSKGLSHLGHSNVIWAKKTTKLGHTDNSETKTLSLTVTRPYPYINVQQS